MPSTKDKVNQHGLFALFKGAPNTAKSGAAYSFPNPFVFDFDRKMPTVAIKHFPDKEFNWESWDDVYALRDWLRPWLYPMDSPNFKPCPYETLIIDSITSLSTLVLLSVDKTKGKSVVDMMQHATTRDGVTSVEVMGIDYYNNETNFFERYFMQAIKILWARPGNPRHVIVIAHEMVVESAPDLKTKLTTTTKSILTAGRKAAVFIPSRFDDEYLFVNETPSFLDKEARVKRICYTSNKDNARSGYKFPEVIDFTNKSLYDELDKVAHWSDIGSVEIGSSSLLTRV
jgi:hypothetical protein